LLKALDKRPATVMALTVLLAVAKMTIFLVRGGLTPWADVSDDMPCC